MSRQPIASPQLKVDISTAVGIDVGKSTFVTLSTGEKFEDIAEQLRELKDKIEHLRSANQRQHKGSRNCERTQHKIARLQRKLINKRQDHRHKLTKELATRQDINMYCVETLDVRHMLQTSPLKGGVRNCAWYEFLNILKYKCLWYGKQCKAIAKKAPSTKMCNTCGYINNAISLCDREIECPVCKAHYDRDINAALNIRDIALGITTYPQVNGRMVTLRAQ